MGVVVTLVAVTLSEVVTTWLLRGEGTAAADQPHRPDRYLGGGGQHPAQHVPGDLRLRPVEQLGQRASGRQQLAGLIPRPGAIRGRRLGLGVALRAGDRVLPASRGEAPLALFLATYCLVASFTETGFSDASTYLLELTLAASLLGAAQHVPETGMKIVVVHNRYRSAAPSGENRVVDQEARRSRTIGHEVSAFERRSDDIEQWSRARRRGLAGPRGVEPGGPPAPDRDAPGAPARRGARAQHLPAAERLRVVRMPGPGRYRGGDDPQLQARLRQRRLLPRGRGLPRLRSAARPGPRCGTDATGARGAATAPVALAMSAHRQAWRSMVAAYVFISAVAARPARAAWACPRTGSSSGTT